MSKKQSTILSNFDILDLCKHLNIPIVDVLSKDQLPSHKIKGLFVINLGDFATGGTHWTCFTTIPKNVFYFDSYGAPPPIEVDKYIKRTTGKKKYFVNKIQLQAVSATYCGWFVVAVLYLMQHLPGSVAKRFDKITDWLNSDDLHDNYDKLLSFFQKVLP